LKHLLESPTFQRSGRNNRNLSTAAGGQQIPSKVGESKGRTGPPP